MKSMPQPDVRERFFSPARTRRVALAGILTAGALVLSLIESLIPPLVPAAPYARVGLPNVVLIAVLLVLGYRYCLAVVVVKCVFASVFSGNMSALVYSLPAGIAAYTLSAVLFKCPRMSITGVSAISSVAHNLTQIAVASAVVGRSMWLTAPWLIFLGAAAGILTGFASYLLLRSVPPRLYRTLLEPGPEAACPEPYE